MASDTVIKGAARHSGLTPPRPHFTLSNVRNPNTNPDDEVLKINNCFKTGKQCSIKND